LGGVVALLPSHAPCARAHRGALAQPRRAPRIREDLEIAGVERWENSAVVLRARIKVIPLEQWNVKREFLRRLKYAFDAAGIEIPYPHLTVYAANSRARTPERFLDTERR